VGIDAAVVTGSSSGTRDYFAADSTLRCAAGYTGVKCTSCSEGYYAQGEPQRCFLCAASVDQTAQLMLVGVAAVVIVAVLSACVALLSSDKLATGMVVFVALQQLAVVGASSSATLPRFQEQISNVFAWLNLLNFNISLLKPGCAGSQSRALAHAAAAQHNKAQSSTAKRSAAQHSLAQRGTV
jgi:hypothetical protein